MTRTELQAHTRKELAALARDNGVVGWHGMSKVDLVLALVKKPAITRSRGNGTAKMDKVAHNGRQPVRPARVAIPVQAAVARNTSGSPGPEEQIESSKYDVGVPTQDLSAKVPRDLPAGYGKDRIVVMVRDPYWLHCYWELTRHAIQRAEAALGQEWHTAKPILRLLDVTSHDTTSTSESHPPRHRHPRRLQQLVHRRQQSAAFLPRRHRLPVAERPVLRAGPLQRRHHAAGRRQRRHRRKLGRHRSARRPTASTPCPAASIRPPAAWSSSSCSRNACAGRWVRRPSPVSAPAA